MKIIKHIFSNVFIESQTLNKKLDIGLSIVCTNSFSSEELEYSLAPKNHHLLVHHQVMKQEEIGPIYMGSCVPIL